MQTEPEKLIQSYLFDTHKTGSEIIALLEAAGYIVVPKSEPIAWRWRYPHIKHWTLRSSPVGGDTISEPLYVHCTDPAEREGG